LPAGWPTARPSPRLARAVALAGITVCGGCGGTAADRGKLFAEGRGTFVSAGCGGCHTVASAHTHGRVGPDFDTSEHLSRGQIRRQLTLGTGGMPSFHGRLSRQQEAAITEFVYQTMRGRR
jgi:mono/diheme cytochrome c family protein